MPVSPGGPHSPDCPPLFHMGVTHSVPLLLQRQTEALPGHRLRLAVHHTPGRSEPDQNPGSQLPAPTPPHGHRLSPRSKRPWHLREPLLADFFLALLSAWAGSSRVWPLLILGDSAQCVTSEKPSMTIILDMTPTDLGLNPRWCTVAQIISPVWALDPSAKIRHTASGGQEVHTTRAVSPTEQGLTATGPCPFPPQAAGLTGFIRKSQPCPQGHPSSGQGGMQRPQQTSARGDSNNTAQRCREAWAGGPVCSTQKVLIRTPIPVPFMTRWEETVPPTTFRL